MAPDLVPPLRFNIKPVKASSEPVEVVSGQEAGGGNSASNNSSNQKSNSDKRFKPVCKICGKKHWPLDPSCIGKKGMKAKAKAEKKAEIEAEKRAKIEAELQKKIELYAEQLAKIKAPATKEIINIKTEHKSKSNEKKSLPKKNTTDKAKKSGEGVLMDKVDKFITDKSRIF